MATATKTKHLTPILDDLEARGIIVRQALAWTSPDGAEFGWRMYASDGAILDFGISTRINLESYLQDYPTPDMW